MFEGYKHKPKQFHYEFRHYDPTEDERKKRRLKIKRTYRAKKTHQTRSVIGLAMGIAFVIWLIVWL